MTEELRLELILCAVFMSFCNFGFGLLFITVKASNLLNDFRKKNESDLFFFYLGFLFIFNTLFLVIGTVKKSEKWVFLYLVSGSTTLFVLTVASILSKYDLRFRIVVFTVLWVGQVCVYSLYKQILKSKRRIPTLNIRVVEQNGTVHNFI